MRKLFVENLDLLDLSGYLGHTPYDFEKYADRNELFFEQDDMGNCYLAEDYDYSIFKETDIEF